MIQRQVTRCLVALAVASLLTGCVPRKLYADPQVEAMHEHLVRMIRYFAGRAGQGSGNEERSELEAAFDQLDELWVDARPAVLEAVPEEIETFDQRMALLHWWNRTAIWCGECEAEGRPQNQEVVTREEIERRFAAVSPSTLVWLFELRGSACEASEVEAIPGPDDSGCAVGLAAEALVSLRADLYAAGVVPKPFRGAGWVRDLVRDWHDVGPEA